VRRLIGLSAVAFFAAAGAAVVYRLDQTGFNITVGATLALLAAVIAGLLVLSTAVVVARVMTPRPGEVERPTSLLQQQPQSPIIIVGGHPQQVPQLQSPSPWPDPSWPGTTEGNADRLKIVGEED
jgi:hypothetical protein